MSVYVFVCVYVYKHTHKNTVHTYRYTEYTDNNDDYINVYKRISMYIISTIVYYICIHIAHTGTKTV